MSLLQRITQRVRTAHGAPLRRSMSGAVRTRIEYDRSPPPEWQVMLDALHVPGTARLYVAWEGGDVWQPIHRWIIWQMQPWWAVPESIQRELTGPSPRTNAELIQTPCTVNGRREMRYRLRGGPCRLIDRRTWALHRAYFAETGERVYPRRLWVCQGSDGGHPFQISVEEQSLREQQGMPGDVPSAGDLPFAEMDARVFASLERYDLWRWANRMGDDRITATVRAHVNRLRDLELDANRLRWAHWENYSREIASGLAHAARQDGCHRMRWTPVGAKARRVDHDREADAYLNDINMEAMP